MLGETLERASEIGCLSVGYTESDVRKLARDQTACNEDGSAKMGMVRLG